MGHAPLTVCAIYGYLHRYGYHLPMSHRYGTSLNLSLSCLSVMTRWLR